MKMLLSAVLALSLSLPFTQQAKASEMSITLAVGVSLSVAVFSVVVDNEFGTGFVTFYDRTDLYKDAINAIAIGEADAISQNLGAFLKDFRGTRADLDQYSDLEILIAMLELEHQ